jgi:hypothetical protein
MKTRDTATSSDSYLLIRKAILKQIVTYENEEMCCVKQDTLKNK